jgi:hypothetical protein
MKFRSNTMASQTLQITVGNFIAESTFSSCSEAGVRKGWHNPCNVLLKCTLETKKKQKHQLSAYT